HEAGEFDFDAVAGAIADKMIRRHPHVFGDETIADAETQTVAWEEHKAREREARQGADAAEKGGGGRKSALDGVITGLPALTRAHKLQKRAARVGFDWDEAAPVVGKVREEIAEVEAVMRDGSDAGRLRDEVGDLLFCCVNLARKLGIDPEQALRDGNAKFERRFRRMEALLAEDGHDIGDLSVEDLLDAYWNRAKRET
ncbi:MAG: nucleoside triphosphate pyrophosphohydrolase, partial [Rhodospirillales bacterium]